MRWIKTVGPTVLSSTTEQKISGANYTLPKKAKTLLAIIPHCSPPAGLTAAEAVMGYVMIQSDSNPLKPFKVLCAPIGSTLGKSESAIQDPAPVYPVNCPVEGGTEIEVWGNGLINHTIEPYVTVDLILADFAVAGPRYKAAIGTLTAMGAATAGETKGSGIKLEGWSNIEEIVGYAIGTTVATLKGIIGKFRLSSSDFGNQEKNLPSMGDLEMAIENIGGAIGVDATTATLAEHAHLTRRKDLDVPVEKTCNIDDYFNLGLAVTTAGKFIVGVLGH